MVLIAKYNVYGISISDEHQISKYLAALVTPKFKISGVSSYYNFSENFVKVENYVNFNSFLLAHIFLRIGGNFKLHIFKPQNCN